MNPVFRTESSNGCRERCRPGVSSPGRRQAWSRARTLSGPRWLFLFILGAVVAIGGTAHAIEIKPGQAAPGFELSALNGKRYRLNDIKGRKALLLLFFDPDSEANRTTLRDLAAMMTIGGVRGIAVWAVACGSEERVRAFGRSWPAPFPLLLDPAGHIAGAYGAGRILPISFVIEDDLKVAARFLGGGPSVVRELERWIKGRIREPVPAAGLTFAEYRSRGVRAFNAKRYDDAERLLRKALTIKADKGAYVYLVYTLRALGKDRDLEPVLREAIARFPREARFYKIYARWLIENERRADAARTVASGLRVAPADVELASLKDYLANSPALPHSGDARTGPGR